MEIQRKLISLYVYAFATELIGLLLNFSRYKNALYQHKFMWGNQSENTSSGKRKTTVKENLFCPFKWILMNYISIMGYVDFLNISAS